ncbi:MAG: response regulator [Acidobacteriota bacterium]
MAHHVLVADDDEHIRFQIVSLLKQRGYSVETANDGMDAIARAIANPPDLLIADVMMPKLDGWSLVRELRSHPRHADLPVIFLTALGTEDDKIEAFRLGADDYVMKPFRLDDLAKRVARALEERRPAAPAAASSGLRGDLAQVGLSTLLVLVEMERKTGVLVVKNPAGQSAEITIRDGKVLQATWRGAPAPVDAECIYQLLRWKAGEFDFAGKPIDAEDRIHQSTTALLMEGARRIDEESAPVRVPAPAAVQASSDDDALAEWSEDERTPLVVAAHLAKLVRKTARSTLPPIHVPVPEPEPEPEPPKPAAPAPPAPARRRAPSALWLVLAVLAAAIGTALPMIVPPPGAPSGDDVLPRLRGDADALATALDTTIAAAEQRAKTLATTPVLRAGIETDAATLQDLAKNEALFTPVGGEVIEVFQLRDGAATSLVRLPAGAPAVRPSLDDTTRLDSDGRTLTIVATAPIAAQSGGAGGQLAVATPCELSAITRVLADHAARASLTGVGAPGGLLAGDGAPGTPLTLSVPRHPTLGLTVTIATATPAASKLPAVRDGLWGAGAVLLALYLGLALVRRAPG